jgi:hypothetical protein
MDAHGGKPSGQEDGGTRIGSSPISPVLRRSGVRQVLGLGGFGTGTAGTGRGGASGVVVSGTGKPGAGGVAAGMPVAGTPVAGTPVTGFAGTGEAASDGIGVIVDSPTTGAP